MGILGRISSSISNRKVLKTLLKNLQWLIIDRSIRYGGGLVVSVLVARYLGPENYGLLSYAMAFSMLFSPIATLSSDGLITRDISWFPEKAHVILGTFLIFRFFASIFTVVITVLGALFVVGEKEISLVLIFLSSLMFVFQSLYVFDLYYQAKLLNKNSVIAQIIGFVVSAILKIYFIVSKSGVVAFALANLIEVVISGSLLALSYRFVSKGTISFSFIIIRRSVRDILLLMLMNLFLMMQARFDQILIKKLIDVRELGLYSVALKVVEFVTIIPYLVYLVSFPPISSAKSQDEAYYFKRLTEVYRFMFLFSLVSSLILILLSDEIISIAFGSQYSSSENILKLLTTRIFIASLGLVRSIYVTNEGLFSFSLVTYFVGALVNTIFNFMLIPALGVFGAILSSNVGFIFTIFLLDPINGKMRKNSKILINSILSFYKILR